MASSTLVLPGANLYVLLCMVNHLSKEDMLSKMAELLETMINWSLKTMLGAVLGLQAVRGLVAPAMDAIKRTALGRTAGAIPAVGNAVNAVTELILAGALLVKNCLGAMAVVVLLLAGAGPVIHYGLLSLSSRFLGAVAACGRQADRRLPWHNGRRLCPASADHADCGNSVCAYLYSSHGVCRRIKVTVSGNEP